MSTENTTITAEESDLFNDVISSPKVDLVKMHEFLTIACKYDMDFDEDAFFNKIKSDPLSAVLWACCYKRERVQEVEDIIVNVTNAKNNLILSYLDSFPEITEGPLMDEVRKSSTLALRYCQFITESKLPEDIERVVFLDKETRELYTELLKFLRDEKEEAAKNALEDSSEGETEV